MKNNNEVNTEPQPDEEFAVHGQSASQSLAVIAPPEIADNNSGVEVSSLGQALHDLSNSSSRRYGINDLLRMASSWAEDVNSQLGNLNNEFRELKDVEGSTRTELAKAREENVAYKTRAEVNQQYKSLVTAAALSSTALVSLSIDQFASQNWGVGLALLVISIFLGLSVYVSKLRGK